MLPIFAAVVLVAVLLIAYTWQMLALMALAYTVSVSFGIRQYRRQNTGWEARSGRPGTRRGDGELVGWRWIEPLR